MPKAKYTYHCPIRGKFDSSQIEEEYVIECLKWLLNDMGVPMNQIAIDKPIARLGAGGKNSLRPDILVFNCPVSDAKNRDGELDSDKVSLVVEVKVSPKDKESAIKYQVYPALDMCRNAVGGIYWDSTLRSYIDRDRKEHSILGLPTNFIHGRGKHIAISAASLMPLKRGEDIWGVLANALRAQGVAKSKVHGELFKILVSKYYDEMSNNPLQFRLLTDDARGVATRINNLYRHANRTYNLKDYIGDAHQQAISLSNESIYKCVQILEPYGLRKTDRAIIQEFYMKFAPAFLKKDLNQYYTPKEVVSFMTEHLVVKRNTLAIDPCCGTGDFMVGLLRKAHKIGVGSDAQNGLVCWDVDDEATKLAKMNMILNGDGRTNVRVINSLNEWKEDNGRYDYVITNPPFGRKSLYDGPSLDKYTLAANNIKDVGKLFFERGLRLLNEGGLLVSVAPTGFFDNPSDDKFRQIILGQARFVGCIGLPAGTFKGAETGVSPLVVILQKNNNPPKDYKIFVAVARKIGFDVSAKNTPPLFVRRDIDGSYQRDANNDPLIDNDLVDIAEQLKSFAIDENLTAFDQPKGKVDYDSVTLQEIQSNRLVISPMRYDRKIGYSAVVKKVKEGDHFTLSPEVGVEVSNSDGVSFDDSKEYQYIATGDVYRGHLKDVEKLRGWQLPGRAKQVIKEGDILVAKLSGSANNFLYVHPEWKGFIASNGFYKVVIPDEKKRLSFFRFLFSDEYLTQAGALPTGSIMSDIKEDDFISRLYIPLLDDKELAEVRELLDYQRKFIKLSMS